MHELFYIIPLVEHNDLIKKIYLSRGFNNEEAEIAAWYAGMATWHGIRTHNSIKALHLDDLFGSKKGGCVPDAKLEKLESRFPASQVWNANRKLGQPTAHDAMQEAMELADRYGIAQISVDNAFHYLWGGGYVMEAAKKGYIAYTNCTAALAEVVPFKGKFPTLGTNPHSWGFPTVECLGFPIVIDWATSVVAMGRVQQYEREGGELPPDAAVDKHGNYTRDPKLVAALTPFGAHKGYGLSLINELMAAYIGGSLPTVRSRWNSPTTYKQTPCFYFQIVHPDALSCKSYSNRCTQSDNVKQVIDDILGHGNEMSILPGQLEAQWAERSHRCGGLLFSFAEVEALNELAREIGLPEWEPQSLKKDTA